MKTTTFETVKVGDKVWSVRHGWGVVRDVVWDGLFPVQVIFPDNKNGSYTLDGLSYFGDINPSLFWDEVKIDPPSRPLPDLVKDTKVLVWNGYKPKTKRHFSHFSSSGKIVCFSNGMTSWTTEKTSEWNNWELAE